MLCWSVREKDQSGQDRISGYPGGHQPRTGKLAPIATSGRKTATPETADAIASWERETYITEFGLPRSGSAMPL